MVDAQSGPHVVPNRNPSELEKAVGQLAASVLDAQDEADNLSDMELEDRLESGQWTTIEVHEAARRLLGRR